MRKLVEKMKKKAKKVCKKEKREKELLKFYFAKCHVRYLIFKLINSYKFSLTFYLLVSSSSVNLFASFSSSLWYLITEQINLGNFLFIFLSITLALIYSHHFHQH